MTEMHRMWVDSSPDGLGADIWVEDIPGSHFAGERTLVWKNVRFDWARALVAAWNATADTLEPGHIARALDPKWRAIADEPGPRFEVRSWIYGGEHGWGVYDTAEERFVGGWFALHIRSAAEAMVPFHEAEANDV